MKTLRNTLIACAVIVALALWLRSLPDQTPATSTAAPDGGASPPAAPAPPAPAVRLATEPSGKPDPYEKIKIAAEKAGIQIASYKNLGDHALISVQWISDITTEGTDFIEGLRQGGIIRNFDVEGNPPIRISYTPDGRRLFGTTYKLKL